MNIVYLTTSYPRFDGDEASIFVARLAEALAKNVESVQVIVPRDSSEIKLEQRQNLSIHRFSYRLGIGQGLAFGSGIFPNLRARPWLVLQIPGLFIGMFLSAKRFCKGDAVVISNWILSAWVARFLKFFSGKPYAYIVRGMEMKIANSLFGRLLFSFAISGAKKVFCVSETFARELKLLFPKYSSKILCIHNGVEVSIPTIQESSQFLTEEKITSEKPYLVSIGTVIPRKNFEFLIDLFAEGLAKKFRLIIVGRLSDQVYVERLKEKIKSVGLEDVVLLKGEVAPARIPLYLTNACAFISASLHEGIPNALLEALALETPVLLSDIPAHRELVEDGESGVIFSVVSAKEAIVKVESTLQEQAKLRERASRAVTKVSQRDWNTTAKEYLVHLKT